ncbi:thermopsin [Vulcanisaeta sp. JCM 16161]|uniref:thermopsin family protease n=1 Tax=Vulcanisaeta sp. JCM 16161 TaxID=1295372 RepID=UPI001FB2D270|nr:thermopsin family protease [Vulcanisaeta sp. JCM 16161]
METQGGYYSVADVVWNETATPSTLTGVVGNGEVTAYGVDEAYEYSTPFSTYKLPLSGYLIIDVAVSGGSAVIGLGYTIIQSGAYRPPQVVWFDNVTIAPDSPVVSAFIEAYNGRLTGSGRPMSLELVFGGYGNGEITTFKSLSAELALAYWDGSGWASPPSIYDYSLNPVGSATDLRVLMQGSVATVSTGSQIQA